MNKVMPIAARRVFRLSLTVALSLAGAYALAVPLPYLAPIFALMFTATPSPPMGLKGLFGLVVLVIVTMGAGLLLIPVLINYPASGLLIVTIGLFLSNYLSVNKGKGAVGAFLTVGLTLITAAGIANFVASLMVVKAMILGIGLAVLCQQIVYLLFPEDGASVRPAKKVVSDNEPSNWIAMRATLIVLPAYLMALINPSMYLPIIMKSVFLGQQGSLVHARSAGRELLGSTSLGGCFAILFWFALGIETTLWMFFLWMALFGLYLSSKLYQLVATRFPSSFWLNVVITMLILLGPAVEDSANGKDVYKAFAIRMSLFIAVTLYAWSAILVLEHLRARRQGRTVLALPAKEVPSC
jgi:DUF2955 family protein